MEFYAFGETAILDPDDTKGIGNHIFSAIEAYTPGAENICIVPPDFSRYQSGAGGITNMLWKHFGPKVKAVIPALGTHHPMTQAETRSMFGNIPENLFRHHNFQTDVTTLGRIPAELIEELSEGRLAFDWPVQMSKLISGGGFDCIVSIGQVVPHEITGMANYTKNLLIGTGGKEAIDKSHYLGAVYGMERIMGVTDTPVRRLLNTAAKQFLDTFPVLYILTVIEQNDQGSGTIAGIFIGNSDTCFQKAAGLSRSVNVHMVKEPLKNCIVYLDPEKYNNFWIGNKGIYRLRMAMADGGTLWVYAPGLQSCGEDAAADAIIRKYGYIGTDNIIRLVQRKKDLQENLRAAAHLIHGSTEDRFSVVVSTQLMDRREIEGLNYSYCCPSEFGGRFPLHAFTPGWNTALNGDQVYYVPDPALGLWSAEKNGYQ